MSSETQVHSQTLPAGYQLEDFRIEAVLGQGGFGITYKATEESLRRRVAIKEYLPQQFAFRDAHGHVHARTGDDESMFSWGLNRFLDEARTLALFRHPNIVSVMRFFEANGTAYLVMEFEEGMDFKHWLESGVQPDEERLVHGILAPLLDGLARVHDKGLLHRDIKPDNVFIRRDGTPVLIDFGASRPHGGESQSQLTSIISAGYSPFEQYGSGERQGPWSDLYALAGTIYRAIAGRPPTDAIARQQSQELIPAVEAGRGRYSARFLKTIDRALAEAIDERPQSAREFLRLLGLEPPPEPEDPQATFVRPEPGPMTSVSRRRRAPSLWFTTAGLIVALATAGGAWWYLASVEQPPTVAGEGAAPAAREGDAAREAPAAREGDAARQENAATQSTAATQNTAATENVATTDSDPVAAADQRALAAAASPVTLPVAALPSSQAAAPADGNGDVSGNDAAASLNEDRILNGLELPPAIRSYRGDQLAGAMLAFTQIKSQFDDCRESGCAELPALLQRLQAAMEPQPWQRGDASGTVTVENPRRLENEGCPFMLDLHEELRVGGETREQTRTYCTSNGFDRVLQSAQDIS